MTTWYKLIWLLWGWLHVSSGWGNGYDTVLMHRCFQGQTHYMCDHFGVNGKVYVGIIRTSCFIAKHQNRLHLKIWTWNDVKFGFLLWATKTLNDHNHIQRIYWGVTPDCTHWILYESLRQVTVYNRPHFWWYQQTFTAKQCCRILLTTEKVTEKIHECLHTALLAYSKSPETQRSQRSPNIFSENNEIFLWH